MAGNWIKGAINPKHKGMLKAKAASAGMSTGAFARKHQHDKGAWGSRSRLALALMGMHHKAGSRVLTG